MLKRFYAGCAALIFGFGTLLCVGFSIEQKSWLLLFVAGFLGMGAVHFGAIARGKKSSGPKPVKVPSDWLKKEGSSDLKKLAEFYMKDMHKEILKDVTASNLATSVDKLHKVVKNIQKVSLQIDSENLNLMVKALGDKNKEELRKQELKAEQARIREQIREEQKVEREMQAKIKKMEDEERTLEKALEVALKSTNDEHSAEIEKLRAEIAELHAKTEREKSNAQLTKAGNVYVISNIGAFGETLFKVGMTRRSDPMDRIDELSDASVPFCFDVHMMIPCDDAPALESKLHASLEKHRYNRVNLRKEFFKVDLDTIVKFVKDHHGEVPVLEIPEAQEYRESMLLAFDAEAAQEKENKPESEEDVA